MASVAKLRFASFELRLTPSGYEATSIYRVPVSMATTALAAMKAPGIPARWSQLFMPDGTPVYAFAKNYTVNNPSETEKVWTVIVEYGELQGQKFFTGQSKHISWNMGMISQHSDVSVNGKWVGSRQGWNDAGTQRVVPPIVLPNPEIGYEMLIPTFEFQIRSPRSTAWDPVTVDQLRGHVNNSLVVLFDNGKTYYFAAGFLLFAGANADPLGTGTGAYSISYNFIGGYRKVEPGLKIYIDDTQEVAPEDSTRILTMRYGVWPRYKAVIENDANGNAIVKDLIAVAWSRFVALPQASFTLLRI